MDTNKTTETRKPWVCPQCGKVYAPHVDFCQECSSKPTITIRYSNPASIGPIGSIIGHDIDSDILEIREIILGELPEMASFTIT